jgi:hypothetical protein
MWHLVHLTTTCGSVIEDVKVLAKTFEMCSFRHVYHTLNVAAHNLARKCEFSVDVVWRGVRENFQNRVSLEPNSAANRKACIWGGESRGENSMYFSTIYF